MTLYNWNDSYSVHVKEVDQQHRMLLNLINELYDAMKAGKAQDVIGKTLMGLINYTKLHFQTEENLMTKYRYANFRQHKAIHDGFVAKAAELQQKFKTGNLTLSVDTLKYLGDWVKQHILETDKKLGAFLHAQGVA